MPLTAAKANFDHLRDNILPILLPYGIKRLALFGSVVTGEDTPESDIDILVTLKPPTERPPIGLKWFGLSMTFATFRQIPE
jgi:predicted nucleotidyltransferase